MPPTAEAVGGVCARQLLFYKMAIEFVSVFISLLLEGSRRDLFHVTKVIFAVLARPPRKENIEWSETLRLQDADLLQAAKNPRYSQSPGYRRRKEHPNSPKMLTTSKHKCMYRCSYVKLGERVCESRLNIICIGPGLT